MNSKILNRLKHKIEFLKMEQKDVLSDAQWLHYSYGFASIVPLSNQNLTIVENINFGHVITEEYFIITMRYVNNITTNMRIKFGKNLYEIKRIINVESAYKLLRLIVSVIK